MAMKPEDVLKVIADNRGARYDRSMNWSIVLASKTGMSASIRATSRRTLAGGLRDTTV